MLRAKMEQMNLGGGGDAHSIPASQNPFDAISENVCEKISYAC